MEEEFSKPDNTPKIDLPVITSLEMAASDLHEMYMALIWSGFTEKQALYIIGTAVAGGMLSAYKHSSDEDEDLDSQDADLDDFDDGEFL